MKKMIAVVGFATILCGGILVGADLTPSRHAGIVVSDAEASHLVGGCVGVGYTTCPFGLGGLNPLYICPGGTVADIGDDLPGSNPTGDQYCGNGQGACSAVFYKNATSCGG